MTIHELLDIDIEDLTLAFGRSWMSKLEAGGVLGEGLHSWPWLKGGVWVTVLDDGDDPSLGIDTPQNDFKIQSDSEEATKIKGLISDQVKIQAQQRSLLASNDQPAVATVSSTKQNKRQRVNDTNKSPLMSVLLKSEYQVNGLEEEDKMGGSLHCTNDVDAYVDGDRKDTHRAIHRINKRIKDQRAHI